MAVLGALLLVAFALAPAAHADRGPVKQLPSQTGPEVGRPGKPADQGKPGNGRPGSDTDDAGRPTEPVQAGKPDQHDEDSHAEDHTEDPDTGLDQGMTSAGHALDGDVLASLADLIATPPPLTAYEMPFPCGEVWTGSTRNGHSPSVRSIDFNYSGGDQGRPVLAAAAGTVVTAVSGSKLKSYGQYVVVDHGNGESSLYAHLDSVLVAVGQPLAMGAQLGTVGSTGNSTGSHLHFEQRVGNAVIDSWFHGLPFPMNGAQASTNCGGAAPPPVVVSTDVPLAGNMYGGRAAELMVFRTVGAGGFHVTRTGKGERVITMGASTDRPVLGDWDGDGRVNPGVRSSTDRVFTLRVRGQDTTVRFGKRADLPVAGNWDGKGAWEIGVWRGKNAKFLLRNADGTRSKIALGDVDDVPVTGDWDGDGVTDVGVYDRLTATFTLRVVDKATGQPVLSQVVFGLSGDLPVAADWDGNAITDLGTWSPTTATFTKRGAAKVAGPTRRVKRLVFGSPGQ